MSFPSTKWLFRDQEGGLSTVDSTGGWAGRGKGRKTFFLGEVGKINVRIKKVRMTFNGHSCSMAASSTLHCGGEWNTVSDTSRARTKSTEQYKRESDNLEL